VVAVDTAAKAHARARRNYELSGLDPAKMEQVTGDALKALERFIDRGQHFDLVVCDPPTFSHGSKPGATFSVGADLAALASASLAVLEPGGFLAFSSNSTKLSPADLDRALAEGAAQRHLDARIIERYGLPPDYPVAPGFPEGNYLKFVLAVRV
jgi:23S rRNA (cytosine1962-C5)-methyltransferase